VIADVHGTPTGIQLGYLDPTGHKVEIAGAERRQYLADHTASGLAFRVVPTSVDPTLPIFIAEGLEDALTLATVYPEAKVIGLPGIGRMRRLPFFRGCEIVVFRDGDSPESSVTRKSLPAGIDHLLIGGAKVKVTDTPEGADANSILQKDGVDAIRALVESATPAVLSRDGVIQQCAALPRREYQFARRQRATELGIRLSALDFEVQLERHRRHGEALSDNDEADIHPEPVDDIVTVLNVARAEVGQYVVADPTQLDMSIMWALHSHFVHHATIDIAISP
jgi:Toprim domain